MVDSGASIHLIGKSSLNAEEKKSIRPTSQTHDIQTANGMIEVSEECCIYIQELDILAWAKLAGHESPSVLALGRICQYFGCSYVWSAGNQPVLIEGAVDINKLP